MEEKTFNRIYLLITLILIFSLLFILDVQADEIKAEDMFYKNPFENITIDKIQDIYKTNTNFKVFEEEFKVTAYDLSVQSCGKKITSRGYGITRTGYDLRGHNWETARVIAVDPEIIPLKSIVYIEFIDENYKKYNGFYQAEDTGRLIKGNKVDFFFEDTGETVSKQAMDFGVTKANIIIIK